MARIAQRAENDYVGAPTGLMDQLAALCGEPRTALMIDFRELTVRPVAFDPDASDIALLLINSRAPHQHAGGEYASRRASCERAAADLGVSSLREVQATGVAALASVADPQVLAMVGVHDDSRTVYDAAAAERTTAAHRRVTALLRRLDVEVVDAGPAEFASKVSDAYLALKAAGRL